VAFESLADIPCFQVALQDFALAREDAREAFRWAKQAQSALDTL